MKVYGWFLALCALLVGTLGAHADVVTATNAVDELVANVTYARTSVVPIAIAALVLLIGIGAGVKFWRRIFR